MESPVRDRSSPTNQNTYPSLQRVSPTKQSYPKIERLSTKKSSQKDNKTNVTRSSYLNPRVEVKETPVKK